MTTIDLWSLCKGPELLGWFSSKRLAEKALKMFSEEDRDDYTISKNHMPINTVEIDGERLDVS